MSIVLFSRKKKESNSQERYCGPENHLRKKKRMTVANGNGEEKSKQIKVMDPFPKKFEEKKHHNYKNLLLAWSLVTLMYSNGILACASYGQNASKWVLDQLFWVLLVGVIIAVAAMAVKRNFVGALTTSLVGAVVVYFVKNPTKLEEIGTSIMKTVGL